MTQQQGTRVGAYGLVVNDERILLCRLSEKVRRFAGQWTLPGGGVEFGEDPAAGMVREVFEETGLEVRPSGIADINSINGELRERNLRFHSIRLVYYTELLGGTLTHEEDGTTDRCAWYTRDEASELELVDLVKDCLPMVFA